MSEKDILAALEADSKRGMRKVFLFVVPLCILWVVVISAAAYCR